MIKNKYYMYAGLPGTFLEYKERFNCMDDKKVFEKLSKIFDVLIKYKQKYFQLNAPLAIVEVFDDNKNLIFCKEERKNNNG